jgi:type II secretory pathway pseudopilin PulG
MMDASITLQIAAAVVALLVVIALVRIYVAAVLPLLRNRRLARRGFSSEPVYQRGGRGIVSLLFKLVPTLAILAILAAIAIPAYQDYAARALDRQRMADIAQLQAALDTYRSDSGTYPVSSTETLDPASFAAAMGILVTDGYLTSLPNDPVGDPATYVYQSNADGSYYCLGANMAGTPPPSTCDTTTLGSVLNTNYMVGP